MAPDLFTCDGCGQPASPEHLARRLQRLEWTTRYRPVHIGTLFLGAASPQAEADFLYAGKFEGESGRLLKAAGISATGRSAEAVLSEFQRSGFFLAHVLECSPGNGAGASAAAVEGLLVVRVAPATTRIRRSLKPRRIVLISEQLAPIAEMLSSGELGCPVILDHGVPFGLDSVRPDEPVARLRDVLVAATAAR